MMCGHNGQTLKKCRWFEDRKTQKEYIVNIFKDLKIMTHPSTPLLLLLAAGGLLFSASWC